MESDLDKSFDMSGAIQVRINRVGQRRQLVLRKRLAADVLI